VATRDDEAIRAIGAKYCAYFDVFRQLKSGFTSTLSGITKNREMIFVVLSHVLLARLQGYQGRIYPLTGN
jgi:hypothetical protein